MLGHTSFGALLGFVVVGALAAVPGGLALWVIVAQPSSSDLGHAIAAVLAQAESYKTTLGIVVGVGSLLLGLIVDAFGHAVVDEHVFPWSRANSLGKKEKDAVEELMPARAGLETDQVIESIFYAHAPEHTLNYHSEQWAYYEFYRNLLVVFALQALAVLAVFLKFRHWFIAVLWLAGAGAGVWLLTAALRFVLKYYYGLETAFVVGHLLDGSESKASPGPKPS